ncbi:hypothetical protein SDC9_101341 [bioreactor metagenome]|uniref:Uncharacterized protein n=1 Tax=bioreactor metagenome TaxID=1076179 RepID=A0A645AUG6_9ZZZZ
MANINAVYDIVQHIDELRRNSGHSQPAQQAGDGVGAKKLVALLHGMLLPF